MKVPSPIENGFNPDTKEWETPEGKENYRKEVMEYARENLQSTQTLSNTI